MLNNVGALLHTLCTGSTMTNIILSLIILCNYGNGKYKPMYCLYIILHGGIIGLIIFSKPRLWAFSYYKPSPNLIQARRWAGLGWALGLAQHITIY